MAMPAVKLRLMEDLHAHLGDRLHQLLRDHVDTCSRADLNNMEMSSTVLSAMLFEVTVAACAMQMDEDHFICLCLEAYQHMRDMVRQKQKQKEKNQ